jgi:hypothetical protein
MVQTEKQRNREANMKTHNWKLFCTAVMSAALLVCGTIGAKAQSSGMAKKGSKPTLTATLIDAEKKAQKKTATVQVTVTGVVLIDPAKVNEKPRTGQGHLHYRVDDGPVIATTTTKLSFHELTSGLHHITVMLAANDHNPLGPEQTLDVNIP